MKSVVPVISLCGLYILANLVFAMSAIFGTKWWDIVYFWYQDIAGGGVLVWFWIYVRETTYRRIILPVFIYSIIIFIWDLISYTTGIGVNSQVATGVGFGLLIIIVIVFMIIDINRRWKQKV